MASRRKMTDDKNREIEHVINLRRYELALLDS